MPLLYLLPKPILPKPISNPPYLLEMTQRTIEGVEYITKELKRLEGLISGTR